MDKIVRKRYRRSLESEMFECRTETRSFDGGGHHEAEGTSTSGLSNTNTGLHARDHIAQDSSGGRFGQT
jgi:hypothetical protein